MSNSIDKSARLGYILAFLVMAIGATVLIGWYTHTIALLRIYPTFVAMAFNTALGFLLSGLGIVAAQNRYRKLHLACGALVLLIGATTLAEYVFATQFGIDELFMKAYVRSGIIFYARMAICTAVCFILSGASLLLLYPWPHPKRTSLTAVLSTLIVSLGLVAIIGYFVGVNAAYEWGRFTRMAVHTAVGFIVLGSAFLTMCQSEDTSEARVMPRWMPVSVGIVAAAVTVGLWQALVIQQSAQFAIIQKLTTGNHTVEIDPLLRMQYAIPYAELAIGFAFAILIGWLMHLAQMAAKRTALLKIARDDLEVRVAERTADLDRTNQALREVLASVSHGKLRLCGSSADLPSQLPSACCEPILLTREEGLSALRRCTKQAIELCQLPDDRGMDLITAVGEASMNAVVHSDRGEGRVYTSPEGKVQVWVSDEGGGILLEDLPRATLERGYTTAGTLGHGFWLMLSTVDCLYLLTGPTGTIIVLEQDREAVLSFWLQKQINSGEFAASAR